MLVQVEGTKGSFFSFFAKAIKKTRMLLVGQWPGVFVEFLIVCCPTIEERTTEERIKTLATKTSLPSSSPHTFNESIISHRFKYDLLPPHIAAVSKNLRVRENFAFRILAEISRNRFFV